MTVSTASIDQLAINTIRTLSMDAVQAANSGHPGTPMALAPAAYVLWSKFLTYDPQHPGWINRDRFVLSCGHASMLLYSLLHLAGVRAADDSDELSITLENIKNFRQLHSPCAGHPEYGEAAGIETTTGPLGQGIGNSVGMAIASRWMSARYDAQLFDHNVYAFCSDGDIMEGVGCEAASLAGHLGLSNLCWVYDDNNITIEGETELAFSEDVAKRFEALGWHTTVVEDANDLDAIAAAYESFIQTSDRPTLIVLRSVIGWGSPNKANSHAAHGAPLGEDEIKLTKEVYGWPDEDFRVPDDAVAHFRSTINERVQPIYEDWNAAYAKFASTPAAQDVQTMASRELPAGWEEAIPTFAEGESIATRKASGKVLNAIAERIPWLLGGSADLAPSNNTIIVDDDAGHFDRTSYRGRNFHFGIREHGMAAAANGMALSGLRPYIATFFVFTDYLRPSMRLASIMHQPVLYILTHDSIGLGEDGPTHQPVEHLAACRAIPGLVVLRPADANETAAAYQAALAVHDRPVALVLTRQNLTTLPPAPAREGALRGGYTLCQSGEGQPDVILIGSGSEVHVCLEAYERLSKDTNVRVVSLPSWELFDQQPSDYREEVLPSVVTNRVAVEAGIEQGWAKYLGTNGKFVGMSSFGASAPYKTLYEHFGITADRVVAAVEV